MIQPYNNHGGQAVYYQQRGNSVPIYSQQAVNSNPAVVYPDHQLLGINNKH